MQSQQPAMTGSNDHRQGAIYVTTIYNYKTAQRLKARDSDSNNLRIAMTNTDCRRLDASPLSRIFSIAAKLHTR